MNKPFKKLLGSRIYLEMPKQKETKVIVDHNTKEDLEKALLKGQNKLKVYAVGSGITDDVLVEGCFVLVEPSSLASAPMIPLTEDITVAMVGYVSIIHIW